jgi:hypothetical protein
VLGLAFCRAQNGTSALLSQNAGFNDHPYSQSEP